MLTLFVTMLVLLTAAPAFAQAAAAAGAVGTVTWIVLGKSIFDALLPVLLPVLSAVGVYLGAKATQWLNSKNKNELLAGIMARVIDAVGTVVKSLANTLVDEYKKANADGKLTPEEIEHLKAVALQEVKDYIGPKGIELAAKVLGLGTAEMDKFLAHKIEAAVRDSKLPLAGVWASPVANQAVSMINDQVATAKKAAKKAKK